MAYSEQLADRIRVTLAHLSDVEEKRMMGGLIFMVNDKMCVGIIGDEMMCRIDPELRDAALEKTGCSIMAFTGRSMKGFVLVDDSGIRNQKEFDYWINSCLDYNEQAKSSKKKNNLK